MVIGKLTKRNISNHERCDTDAHSFFYLVMIILLINKKRHTFIIAFQLRYPDDKAYLNPLGVRFRSPQNAQFACKSDVTVARSGVRPHRPRPERRYQPTAAGNRWTRSGQGRRESSGLNISLLMKRHCSIKCSFQAKRSMPPWVLRHALRGC